MSRRVRRPAGYRATYGDVAWAQLKLRNGYLLTPEECALLGVALDHSREVMER
jgi:hypothetical protein